MSSTKLVKSFADLKAFFADGGRTRKALREEPDAPLYVAPGTDEDEEYFVLTDRGRDSLRGKR